MRTKAIALGQKLLRHHSEWKDIQLTDLFGVFSYRIPDHPTYISAVL